ncbi:sigma-70 family RNA polymerase sigma factor [Dactylosporangium fulvum]|uniref:RNA polymerase sigma factor SigJ n=1 Tax=Dactylosporangium fulvum TaxID=53359 RepID=A0ABY5W4M9_9ACTN|nr:RNA polymerase sigma factor SigJ [Dactylosporangium fulvum]UWP84414.1 RNA polymerase sigma factor SigJ [Dactylosporangium fulvum]
MTEFVAHRPMLYGLAYRLLGSVHDAEDVLQEAYLRWTRADRSDVAEPRRYLTRVVARLALDVLRSRQARREEYVGTWLPEPVSTAPSPFGAVDTSDLSIAVLHLMERLTPPQRAVYVLHTAFGLPYGEIGAILGRGADDCRQLHHRASDAIGGRPRFPTDPAEHARLLDGFVAAAREGDVERLERLLHDDVVVWSDGGGKARAARNPIFGRAKTIRFCIAVAGRMAGMSAIELNGEPGLLVDGHHRYSLSIAVVDGRVHDVYLVANPDKLATFAAAAVRG